MLLEKIHLEDDERVLRMIRKHWFIIVAELIGIALLALLPLIIWVFVQSNLGSQKFFANVSTGDLVPYFTFGTAAWLLLLTMAAAAAWTHYYLDLWVVTTKRVVLIDQKAFFWRFISSFRLERLQDINIEINGILPTLLNFGTIEAQTAGGSNEEFLSHGMPDPRGIKALIVETADYVNRKNPEIQKELARQGL